MKIAIYARYSSDIQNPTSIDDQISLCKKFIKEKFDNCTNIVIFSDSAQTGANLNRDGFKELVLNIKAKQVDVVVAEGLDRISRSLTDSSYAFDVFNFYNTKIITVQEGEISQLHIGLKGTMNSMFLKDLKTKIKRGQIARVEKGYASGPPPYGYEIVRGVVDEKNRNVNGIRRIKPEEAKIVIRIFEEYASGKSVLEIARGLTADNILTGKRSKEWSANALLVYGSPRRTSSNNTILMNEIYIGNIIYNRKSRIINPETGKYILINNPEEKWVRKHVPELRIISQELWNKVRLKHALYEKNKRTNKIIKKQQKEVSMLYNQSALTNFVFCGVCGSQKSRGKFTRYICDSNRYKRGCKNGRSANEEKILTTLKRVLLIDIKNKNFKEIFTQKNETANNMLEKLKSKNKELDVKINKLIVGIENGVKNCLERAIELKDEQQENFEAIKNLRTTIIPEKEFIIKKQLAFCVKRIFGRNDKEELRFLLNSLVNKIVLTPIEDKRTGEHVTVHLKPDGWINFWNWINRK